MGRGKSKKRAASQKRAAASSPPPQPDPIRSEADKELERIHKLFYTYANDSSGLINPQGIEILCSHLGVAHTDIRMLMLAWKMQAGRQGYFTLEEWQNGAKDLKADTLENLKKAFGQLEEELESDTHPKKWVVYSRRKGTQHKNGKQEIGTANQANQTANDHISGESLNHGI